MKINPAIVIKNNQIFDQNNKLVNLRGFTIDQKTSSFSQILKQNNATNWSDFFDDIKSRGCAMVRWVVYWDIIEEKEGCFNEEYLAKLRDIVKAMYKNEILVYFVPKAYSSVKDFWGINNYPTDKLIDNEPAGKYLVQCFSDAMNHLARRIKDCENVIGFAFSESYPEIMKASLSTDDLKSFFIFFVNLLHKKHSQYFFIAEETGSANNEVWQNEDYPKYQILSGVFLANKHIMIVCKASLI